jgi:hypothetical protein
MERNPSVVHAAVHAPEQDVTSRSASGGSVESREAPQASPQGSREKRPFDSIFRIGSLRKRLENASDQSLVETLHAEILLLREENAQLRTKLERAPQLGDVVEQMRALSMRTETTEDAGDHAWHLLTEAAVVRDSLIDLCRRTSEAMGTLEGRLQELNPEQALGSARQGNGGVELRSANVAVESNAPVATPLHAAGPDWPYENNQGPSSGNGHVTEDKRQ